MTLRVPTEPQRPLGAWVGFDDLTHAMAVSDRGVTARRTLCGALVEALAGDEFDPGYRYSCPECAGLAPW